MPRLVKNYKRKCGGKLPEELLRENSTNNAPSKISTPPRLFNTPPRLITTPPRLDQMPEIAESLVTSIPPPRLSRSERRRTSLDPIIFPIRNESAINLFPPQVNPYTGNMEDEDIFIEEKIPRQGGKHKKSKSKKKRNTKTKKNKTNKKKFVNMRK